MAEFRCPECGYVFDEARGDEHEGYPPGTLFDSLPADFACPDCAVRFKEDFEAV
jgi:rubredoxin